MRASKLLFIFVFVLFLSCDNESMVGVDPDEQPENGIIISGTEGVEFSGSITYEFRDGRAQIADLADLSVPEVMEFDRDVLRAEIDLFKRSGTGVLTLSLVENGEVVETVKTEAELGQLSLTYNPVASDQ